MPINNGWGLNGNVNSAPMNYYGNQYPGNYAVQPQQGYFQQHPVQQVTEELTYVHGIEGANAYQLPPGVVRKTLWDDTDDTFYVKGYDNTGRPKVLAWNDYHPHEEKPAQSNADSSIYVTRDELQAAISDFNKNAYVTQKDLNRALSKLRISDDGRDRGNQ